MAFTTSCFVRVDGPEKLKKLIECLEGIGYKKAGRFHGEYVIATGGNIYTAVIVRALDPFIDCGTNVELFRALAAMNDENDREQWFVVDDGFEEEMVCSKSEVDYDYILSCYDHRKATTEEIISYFKNKENE